MSGHDHDQMLHRAMPGSGESLIILLIVLVVVVGPLVATFVLLRRSRARRLPPSDPPR
jgi:hypothetical protein